MQKVSIKLTEEQRDAVASLRKGKHGNFAILGEALIEQTGAETAGTAYFYYCDEAQHAIIRRAILRAKKLEPSV